MPIVNQKKQKIKNIAKPHTAKIIADQKKRSSSSIKRKSKPWPTNQMICQNNPGHTVVMIKILSKIVLSDSMHILSDYMRTPHVKQ